VRHSQEGRGSKYLLVLSIGTLGVVFGDIGTSPLYALRECFNGPHGVPLTTVNVLGILSLVFWSLIIIISVKYLGLILRADNKGEGGIIALMSLIPQKGDGERGKRFILILMGLFGASLLYGDGMITPAISVLSAVEGLSVATTFFDPYVIPITIVILVALFLVQKRGTAGVGAVFGPVTLLWFITIGTLGGRQIIRSPEVLDAVNPYHAVHFFTENGWHAFLVLGAVFLVVTGAEALYADLGHFGILPIRLTWFTVVLPGLLLNYFGQGALLLTDPSAVENPFYRLAPPWALYPLVGLATAATVIASQAVISGSFSLTRQAVQLGYLPRFTIEHTSAREIGQIYIPAINWLLMFACIALVLGFRSSSNLAAAYGVAVTTDMLFTTIIFAAFLRMRWGWKLPVVFLLTAAFLVIDLSFWSAMLNKIPSGGWFPLVVAGVAFVMMTTWRRGRLILNDRLREGALPPEIFFSSIERNPPTRVPGTAVFLYRNPEGTPTALLHNLKHNKVLHEKVVFMTVTTEETPHVPLAERFELSEIGAGIFRLKVHYGFMQDPNVPDVLSLVKHPELTFDPSQTTYFLGRETLIATGRPGMAQWRERLFAMMSSNSRPATHFFGLPPNRVVELGAQVEL
jgi:KUP system potassium uptake protein